MLQARICVSDSTAGYRLKPGDITPALFRYARSLYGKLMNKLNIAG